MAYVITGGAQAYVSGATFDWTGAYTIGFWYRWNGSTEYPTVVGLTGTSDSTVYEWLGQISSTGLLAMDSAGGSADQWVDNSGATVTVNTWCYICLRRNSSTSLQVLLNGVAGGTTNTANTSGKPALNRVAFGSQKATAENPNSAYYSNIMIWTEALTDAQIVAQMQVIRPLWTTNLLRWWPTFNGATERVKDYSGNAGDLSEIATITEISGPPVSYGAPVWVVQPPHPLRRCTIRLRL